jgi:hypothetical protein
MKAKKIPNFYAAACDRARQFRKDVFELIPSEYHKLMDNYDIPMLEIQINLQNAPKEFCPPKSSDHFEDWKIESYKGSKRGYFVKSNNYGRCDAFPIDIHWYSYKIRNKGFCYEMNKQNKYWEDCGMNYYETYGVNVELQILYDGFVHDVLNLKGAQQIIDLEEINIEVKINNTPSYHKEGEWQSNKIDFFSNLSLSQKYKSINYHDVVVKKVETSTATIREYGNTFYRDGNYKHLKVSATIDKGKPTQVNTLNELSIAPRYMHVCEKCEEANICKAVHKVIGVTPSFQPIVENIFNNICSKCWSRYAQFNFEYRNKFSEYNRINFTYQDNQ